MWNLRVKAKSLATNESLPSTGTESTHLVHFFSCGPGKLWNGSKSLQDMFHAFAVPVTVT